MNVTITVNNTKHEFSEEISLQEMLSQIAVQQHGVAIAVNNNIVTKTEWDNVTLKTNDAVLIITATQGG